jgi:hypothetical protein
MFSPFAFAHYSNLLANFLIRNVIAPVESIMSDGVMVEGNSIITHVPWMII